MTHYFELSNKTGRTCEDILPLLQHCMTAPETLKDHKAEIVLKKPAVGTWTKEIPVLEFSCMTHKDNVIEGEIFAAQGVLGLALAIPEMAARIVHGKELADAFKECMTESN